MSLARLLLLLLTFVFLVGSAEAKAPRPHVVFLLADDLGWGDVGFHGGEIATPQIDALAREGARLEQLYAQPLCTPTRAALLTGRYPTRYGLQRGVVRPWARYGLPLDERLLSQALAEVGYATAITGKWHLGHFARAYLPTRRGFERQYGPYNGAIDSYTHERDGGLDWHRDDAALREPGHATDLIAREAARIIAAHDPKRPLVLYVPFTAVHAPYQADARHAEPYAHFPAERRRYAGMLAALDEAIGRILAALEAKGLRDDTLIVFCSDNGGPAPGVITSNGPLRGGKGTFYEGGVRVPAIAVWKGRIEPGRVVASPLHMVDWYPTLLGLAGASLEQPHPLDGRDAWPAISRGAPSPHEEILLGVVKGGGAIRVGDWKLIVDGGGDRVELFDLAADPAEKTNLAVQEPARVKAMRLRLDAHARTAAPSRQAPKPPGFVAPAVWGEPS
jgi:arylsulfatase A-like enzyme